MHVGRFGGTMEDAPVSLRSTEASSITKERSKTAAKTEAKAKPGQRRPATSEVECKA